MRGAAGDSLGAGSRQSIAPKTSIAGTIWRLRRFTAV
jgi:hypothetical protein